MQTGFHAARRIRAEARGKPPPKPFKYRDLGSMAAVSRRRAIVSFHGIRLHGYLGWLAWLTVHLTFMTGYKNRFRALFSWGLSFVGRGRGERAIPTAVSSDPEQQT